MQPFGAESVNEEIEQSGKRDADNRIELATVTIARFYKLVIEQYRDRERPGSEGIVLGFVVLGIDLVEMNLT
jgi:hypothetical protein